MNMKKSLIALAVASTFAAPAFAATSNVDIYGVVSVSVDRVTGWTNSTATQENSAWRVNSNTSRIGFKGAEDLGGGMKALWQIEQGLNADSAAGAFGGGNQRNTFVGLGGGFGTMLMGAHDTPYKLGTGSLDPFADTMGDYNQLIGSLGGANVADLRLGNVLAYISPTWNGFHFAVAKSYQMETGNKAPAGRGDPTAYSGTAVYSNGPVFASLSFEKADNVLNTGLDLRDYKLGLGYTMGDTKFGFVWERIKATTTTSSGHRNAWLINVAHNMGPITLKAEYGSAGDVSGTSNTGAKLFALGADYNLSKRTTAYAVYSKVSNDTAAAYNLGGAASAGLGASGVGNVVPVAGKDPSGISIGLKHSF